MYLPGQKDGAELYRVAEHRSGGPRRYRNVVQNRPPVLRNALEIHLTHERLPGNIQQPCKNTEKKERHGYSPL